MNYSAVVVAAGSGTRTGLDFNKVLYPFQNGRIIDASIRPFLEDPECRQLIVVISPDDEAALSDLKKHEKLDLVYGGTSRMESVYHGLQKADQEFVLIHDGARPFLMPEKLEDLKAALEENPAAALALKVRDSLRRQKGEDLEIVDRRDLYQMQTPQAFKTRQLLSAYHKALDEKAEATDDVEVAARAGIMARLVDGSLFNIKVTEPQDLQVLEGLADLLWKK